jgi:predicted ABC-type ATPase
MPHLIIIAGANGSGKSTAAPALLQNAVHIDNFVNADVIAQGLCAFQPEKVAIQAGRVMLNRIHQLAEEQATFAFETTLSSRTFAPWITRLKEEGYQFHLIFLWLKTEELAVSRVQERIQMGGHSVPESTIRRRYHAGLKNFFNLYQPITDSWQFYDNSDSDQLSLIASENKGNNTFVEKKVIWEQLFEGYHGN